MAEPLPWPRHAQPVVASASVTPASARPAGQARWDRRLAAVLGVLGLGSAVALSSLLLPWVPDLPSHLPPPVQRWLGAVVPEPDWDAASTGPWLQRPPTPPRRPSPMVSTNRSRASWPNAWACGWNWSRRPIKRHCAACRRSPQRLRPTW
ncbi:MAG: hypothetical protein GAK30_01975 [Paracidovorax wautersii]|uniref:Uncharacterized protein n=1 Tax=Paracidovorax wautersii TaxID=1177982 RepID=A0A7V8FNT5_9BURK|nr:MAG: hypothetical protein GAK30_01975 [Paracidovorax wautersii]